MKSEKRDAELKKERETTEDRGKNTAETAEREPEKEEGEITDDRKSEKSDNAKKEEGELTEKDEKENEE